MYERAYERSNSACFSIKGEVSCVEYMDLRIRHILAVALRLAEIEREIVLAPQNEELWLCLPHPRLPLGIGLDVLAVIVEEIALNLRLPRSVQKGKLIGPEIWVIELDVRIVSDVARLRGCQRKKVLTQRFFICGSVGPECPPRCPVRSESFVVSDRILDDQRLHTFRMCQCHAKTNRAAVILHIQRVTR